MIFFILLSNFWLFFHGLFGQWWLWKFLGATVTLLEYALDYTLSSGDSFSGGFVIGSFAICSLAVFFTFGFFEGLMLFAVLSFAFVIAGAIVTEESLALYGLRLFVKCSFMVPKNKFSKSLPNFLWSNQSVI